MDRSYGTLVRVAADRVIKTARRHDARARRPAAAASSTRRAMRCTTTASGTSAAAASSPATPSACRTASSTRARGAWIMPTTTPVQFQPEALRRSIERMLAFSPQRLLLTHYGRGRGRAAPRRACSSPSSTRWSRWRRSLAKAPDRHAGAEARARVHPPEEPARARRHAGRRAHPRAARASTSSSMPRASASGSTAPEPDHDHHPLRFHRQGRRRHRRRQRHRRRLRPAVRRERREARALGRRRRRGARRSPPSSAPTPGRSAATSPAAARSRPPPRRRSRRSAGSTS